MRVKRAEDGRGTVAMRCTNCHQAENAPGLHAPPGTADWRLPPLPIPMVFQGVSPGELCRALKDPKQNGGKNLARLVEHVREDPLVRWGFRPGEGRTTPPLSHEEFVRRFEEWAASGGRPVHAEATLRPR